MFFSCVVGPKRNSMTSICLAPQYFGVDASTMRMVTKRKQWHWAEGCLEALRDNAIVHLPKVLHSE